MGFESAIETAAKDTLHVIEDPFVFLDKATKVIELAIKEQPVVKADVLTLITQAKAVAALVATDIAERGLNPVDDLATIAAIKTLVTFITANLVPDFETIYGQVKADVTAS